MARINISIPDELKVRMDKHLSINWSQAASEQFESKINEIELSVEIKDMTGAIARLKASKANFKNDIKKQGYQFGLEWAMVDADYEELNRLSKSYKEMEIPECLKDLERLITDQNYDLDDLIEHGIEEPEFIAGFMDAAIEVFNKVD
jgi:hypothetical protein